MKRRIILIIFIFSVVTQISGCASSVPTVKFTQTPAPQVRIDVNDKVDIAVDAAAGVSMVDYEKQRLVQRIKEKLVELQVVNADAGEENVYKVKVVMTRYSKGNAFARAMLAGLGQIHLDADVQMYSGGTQEKLANFNVSKTFAWGGIYGASTSMEDLEPAFAEAIARALTGQTEAEQAGKKNNEK